MLLSFETNYFTHRFEFEEVETQLARSDLILQIELSMGKTCGPLNFEMPTSRAVIFYERNLSIVEY